MQKIIGTYATGPAVTEFHSLADSPEKNVPVLSAGANKSATVRANTNSVTSADDDGSSKAGVDEVVSDQLVPDTNFATLLSEDLEVQVGEQIYKITPEGTFFTDAANQEALETMISDRALTPDEASDGILLSDDTFDMGEGIIRYDTFKKAEDQLELQESSATSGTSGTSGTTSTCGIAQPDPSYVSFSPQLTPQQYCSFPVYAYGAKTVVGGWLQSLFGVNTSRTVDFDSNHRISLKLYNFNYLVYSSIGLKAKFQKKGFLGLWGSMRAPKLVLGWDMVMFDQKVPFTPPNPVQPPSFPGWQIGKVVTKETMKFVNFEVPASMVSELASGLVYRVYPGFGFAITPSDIQNELANIEGKGIAALSTKLWNYANGQLAPSQVAFQKSVTAGFRMIYADKSTVALNRWETSDTNTGEINLVFDWNTCRVTYNGTLVGNFNLVDNVLKPTYDNGAMSYDVKKTSVYGAAQYGSDWKGLRIVQE